MTNDSDIVLIDLMIHLLDSMSDKQSPDVKKSIERAKFFTSELHNHLGDIDSRISADKAAKAKEAAKAAKAKKV